MPFCALRRAAILVAVIPTLLHADLGDSGNPIRLPKVEVSEAPPLTAASAPPQAVESIAAAQTRETVNVVDVEDAVKYLPSVFLRKRNYGDTQPTMATRMWGVSSSARSLVYADGVLLSALVANNNNIGAPRWGLVAPEEIERIDLAYGPFSAAYPGNSMGAVMEITTRQPAQFEGSLTQTGAWQFFDQYGTRHTFRTRQSAATLGNRVGKFSAWVSANYQDSHSQPLSYVTNPTLPVGTTGGYAATNKLGQPANVVGASGLLHTRMTNAKFKAGYDLTPTLSATYTFGLWHNDADAGVESYLRDLTGQPTFAGLAGFASGDYQLSQQHSMHSLALKTDTKAAWDIEATASRYWMDRDWQRFPTTASPTETTFGTAGRVAVLAGTGWDTLDAKATWRPRVAATSSTIRVGLHDDRVTLYNPTFNTSDWRAGSPYTSVATEGDGKTRTQAAWADAVWQPSSTLKVTAGLRYENWRAYDGLNINGATTVRQPEVEAHRVSPKASLAWQPAPDWVITASIGQAYRFATPAELYQLVSTGTTFTSPKPDLKPDDVLATELRAEHRLGSRRVRLSLFQDDIHDAIIAQFNPLGPGSTQVFSYLSNVDHIRARGAELVIEQSNVAFHGLSISASVTYVDAKTLALSGQPSANAPASAAIGKKLPNIPDWRAAFVVTYRPNARWSFTAAGRYSGMMFTTLDNADVNPNTWQGFAAWFVADTRVHCTINAHWSASLGADNVLNRKYFLFHPFPQRTVIAEVKLAF